MIELEKLFTENDNENLEVLQIFTEEALNGHYNTVCKSNEYKCEFSETLANFVLSYDMSDTDFNSNDEIVKAILKTSIRCYCLHLMAVTGVILHIDNLDVYAHDNHTLNANISLKSVVP